jgi:hypothetical protein
MANIITIAQAKLIQRSMYHIFGLEPKLIIGEKTIKIYYDADKLILVQKKIEIMSNKKGEIEIDFFSMFLPFLIKRSAIPAVGLMGIGFLLGSKN